MEQARHPAPEHGHAYPGSHAGRLLAPNYAGEGFDEDALLVRYLLRKEEDATIDIDRGNTYELGEAARIEVGGAKGVANRMMAAMAVMTGVAWDVVGDKDPVADLVLIHVLSDLDDVARYLVTQDARGLLDPIPFHDIGAAYAARYDLDEELVRADLRHWHVLDTDIRVTVVHSYAQGSLSPL
jgi:hypothetical protein